MKIIVTGGAGFIGSHIVDALIARGDEVKVIDNLSRGFLINLNPKAIFVKKDLVNDDVSGEINGADAVFHAAADPEVSISAAEPLSGFENNVIATFRVLEACRKNDVKRFLFSSTSAVVGETELMPTPENIHCEPISNYGASKLACEAYCASYAHSYGIKTTVFRYANVYGERGRHGVLFDFFHKLKKNPDELEILGNGKQRKSYVHVQDCISAKMRVMEKQHNIFEIFNISGSEQISVDDIARYVSATMGLKPSFKYTGGERGWIGDVRKMLLDNRKLAALGWKPKVNFKEGLKQYLEWLASAT